MPLRAVAITNRHPRLRLDRRAVARVIHTLDANASAFRPSPLAPHPSPSSELSVVFLTDDALAHLHADFLADPTVTDVITFAGDPAHGTAGEICISADAALRQVSSRHPITHNPSPIALSAELTLYLIHGWLHLTGYDDLAPAKKRQMRRAEARAMSLLRAAGALPSFSLRR